MVALPTETLAVAVRAGDAPAAAEGLPESEATEVMRPGPVPSARARWVWPAGRVHAVVPDDLSAQ